ncbi:MAG: response regulator [Melioribacteraceae bacterium]|nr:response regulator [Melioribacteraceae bacterium]
MRVLVVDDDNVSLAKMKAIMSKYGSVELVDNGLDSINLVKKAYENGTPFDLCTMDIEMPNLDGTETVERIRQLEKNFSFKYEPLKIIMVTVKGQENNIISSFYNGCEWYLKKPITPGDIENALKKIKII